jgi:UDP-N-acetylmuramoylalanine--D-glutamate ligase
MKQYDDLFRGKKITLMGLGLLGRGVGDAAFLASAGADLTVTDLKTETDLASSIEPLKKFKNIRFVLGGHQLEDFQKSNGVDLVVKAAGVPLDSPFILEAQKTGVPVTMSTVLFAEYTEAKVVGITGTRGKSTVSYLLADILKADAEKNSTAENSGSSTVFLGGNILGVSTLDLLSKTKHGDIAVLELDSWQLQGFAGSHNRQFPAQPEGFSPSVAVFTTFMSDHMNYYASQVGSFGRI